jgi:hypothetical protein
MSRPGANRRADASARQKPLRGKSLLPAKELAQIKPIVKKLTALATDASVRRALQTLARGQAMTRAQAQAVTELLDSPDCGLTVDELTAIRIGLETCADGGADEGTKEG